VNDVKRQRGCPLSPLLFMIYVADMDEMLRKAQAGGSVIGREWQRVKQK
jgi:predicted enzyme related to lactoylglutathione lyase